MYEVWFAETLEDKESVELVEKVDEFNSRVLAECFVEERSARIPRDCSLEIVSDQGMILAM